MNGINIFTKSVEKREFKCDGKSAEIIVFEPVEQGEIVKIITNNSSIGIKIEYLWIKEKYPDFKVSMQRLSPVVLNGKNIICDILEIVNGAFHKTIFFDISDFFGKI
jgi:hypothetical protein